MKRLSRPLRHRIAKRCMQISRFLAPMMIRSIESLPRPFEIFVKSQHKHNLVGCEIGVAEGVHAESLMLTLHPQKLFLIDPYEKYVEEGRTFDRPKAEKKARERLKRFGNRVIFIKEYSENAICKCSLPRFDFVYIDGNHDERHVSSDLNIYYTNLKRGGIIGGHDFGGCYVGLIKAVVDFARGKNLDLHGSRTDFWMVKNV